MSPFRIYWAELRRLGFIKIRSSQFDRVRRHHYSKLIDGPAGAKRRLLVRVQADNLNEVMHLPLPCDRIDPRGTSFYTIAELLDAIAHESAVA